MPRPGTRPDRTDQGSVSRPTVRDAARQTRRTTDVRRHRASGQQQGSEGAHVTDTAGQTEDDADARERRRDALWGLAILVLAAVLVGLLLWAL